MFGLRKKIESSLPSFKPYDLVDVPIEKIYYLWWSSHFGVGHQHRMGGWYLEMEDKLSKSPQWLRPRDTKERQIKATYFSLLRDGLKNPLVVLHEDGMFYTIIGNLRLACLRAQPYQGTVSCRIAKPGDRLNDKTEALKLFPYEKVKLEY